MPTQVLQLDTDSRTRVTMKWKEPYVTEGINKKLYGVIPHGVYRGFLLGTSVTNMHVTLTADATFSDHVVVVRDATGNALSIRMQDTALIELDLTAAANTIVILAVQVMYTATAATTAEIRSYTAAEWAALTDTSGIVALGTVVVPLSGSIPSSNISPKHRDECWANVSASAIPWIPLVRNSGFEHGNTNDASANACPPWRSTVLSGGASWLTVSGSGGFSGRVLRYQQVTGPSSARLEQVLNAPLGSATTIRLVAKVQALTAAGGSAAAAIQIVQRDASGSATALGYVSFPITSAGSLTVIDETIAVTPVDGAVISAIQILGTNISCSAGPVFVVDDIQLFIQPTSMLEARKSFDLVNDIEARSLTLRDSVSGTNGSAATLQFDSTADSGRGTASWIRADGDTTTNPTPTLSLKGPITATPTGSLSSTALTVTGGSPNGKAIVAQGTGTALAIQAVGGSSAGTAIYATGGAGGGAGVHGRSSGATSFSSTGEGVIGASTTVGVRGVGDSYGVVGQVTVGGTLGFGVLGTGLGAGAGGVFNGGTTGNAIELAAGATSGAALYSSRGGVSIPPAADYGFTTAKTGVLSLTGSDFQGTVQLPFSSSYGLYHGSNASSGNVVSGRLGIPAQATITGITVYLANIDGTIRTVTCYLLSAVLSTNTFTSTPIASAGFSLAATGPATPGSYAFSPITAGGGPVSSGYRWLAILIPATTSTNQVFFYGADISYSYTVLSPI